MAVHALLPIFNPLFYQNFNGACSKVMVLGTCVSKNLSLGSVLFVLDFDRNLFSISFLNQDLNFITKFVHNSCIFQDLASREMIGNADYCDRLYLLKLVIPHFLASGNT